MKTCSLPDCDMRHHAHGLCKVHDQRQRRHGDPTIVRMGSGEQNPNWQGDEVGYVGAHKRVHRERGQASAHTCVDCGAQAAQWSYNHNDPDELTGISRASIASRYSADPSYYEPRCHPCHRAFDREELTA